MISPLKEGKTSFSVLKNNRERFVFEVEITKNKTSIKEVKGFEILTIDEPETDKFEEVIKFYEQILQVKPKIYTKERGIR